MKNKRKVEDRFEKIISDSDFEHTYICNFVVKLRIQNKCMWYVFSFVGILHQVITEQLDVVYPDYIYHFCQIEFISNILY